MTLPDADRVAGALLGLAAGDALGAGYEFTVPAADDPIVMNGGGPFGWAPGEWTDDTQMAICVAQAISDHGRNVGAIGDAFLGWYRSGPTDVGAQTSAVLSRAISGRDLAALAAEHFRQRPHGAAGNGSLMRTAPVALSCLGDDEALAEHAIAVSALTHGDPLAGEACVVWCVAIDRAVREHRLDGVRDGVRMLSADRSAWWSARLDEAEREAPSAFASNGFVVAALQAAWSAIVHTAASGEDGHLQRALVAAVRIGHDTDTVAAIAGQLLGARYGASSIPVEWLHALHGWPGMTASGLAVLAPTIARSPAV